MRTTRSTPHKFVTGSVAKLLALLLVAAFVVTGCVVPSAPVAEAPAAEAPAEAAPAEEASTAAFPVTIENCGVEITYDAPPTRAVTMNQATTEIMLALGLEGSMVGTAYMDDTILPAFEDAYNSVPTLATEYPSQEVLLNADPDFVYAAYSSAFGDEAAGPRENLLDLGINSYLQVVACADRSLRPEKATFDTLFDEIRDIGAIFGISERAEVLIAEMQGQLDDVLATIGEDVEPLPMLWFDSGTDEVFAGACCGTPDMIIEAVGAVNLFDDLEGNWNTVSWETVIERDPEAIVLVDAVWDTAASKRETLADPALSSITAVQNERYVEIPFSATTLGVRNVSAVVDLAKELYPEKFTDGVATDAAAAATAAGFPLTLENCGVTVTFDAPPERVVSANQVATEMLFSLGLEDRMIGTAFMDDPILPQFEEVYATVPVLSEDYYPSKEVILAADPDFVYSAYWGAFHETTGGTREELQALGINTWVHSNKCFEEALRPAEVTFDTLFEEIRTLGQIFGVPDRAEALIAQEQAKLDEALAAVGDVETPARVIWYDSGTDELLIAPCCNPQTMIIEAAGAINLFDDFSGDWAEVGWEPVIDRNPEVIIVTDALWGPATDKIALLESNPLSQDLDAVQNQRYVALPFSASQMGVRNADAVLTLVEALYGEPSN